MSLPSVHHSFDAQLAAKYGIAEAIVIHHIAYWINFNKRKGKNFIEGRTWMYQSMDDMAYHFPYFNTPQIREVLYRLCNGKSRRSSKKELDFEPVLLTANFNHSSYDRTKWYAFTDSFLEKLQIEKESSSGIRANAQNVNISSNTRESSSNSIPLCHSSTEEKKGGVSKTSTPFGQKPNCYKDNILKKDPKKKDTSEPSELALGCASFLFETLEKINPKIKKPILSKWATELENAVKKDQRTFQELRAVIDYLLINHQTTESGFTWSRAVQSPVKLRKHFATIWLQMQQENRKSPKQMENERKVEAFAKNQAFAKQINERLKSILEKQPTVRFHLGSHCVQITSPRFTHSLGYTENGFEQILESMLEKADLSLSRLAL